MEMTTVLTPLISAVAVTVASLIKDRSVRNFENRTKRIQFWKTMLDASPLCDVSENELIVIKEELRREIGEATNEVVLKHNQLLGNASIIPTLGFVWIIAVLLGQVSSITEHRMLQEGASKDAVTQFAITWMIIEISALFFAGFQCRNFLRRWLWELMKPGGPWQRVRENRQLQGLVGIGSVFVFLALMWISRDLMSAPQ